MRINVSISKKHLEIIDQHCKNTGLSRSTFLIRSALIELQEIESGLDKKNLAKMKEAVTLNVGMRPIK